MKKIIVMAVVALVLMSVSCKKNEPMIEEPVTEQTTAVSSVTTETTLEETTQIVESSTTARPEIVVETEETTQTQKATETTVGDPVLSDFFIYPGNDSRPIAIMIDNEGYKSYPQGGIQKAQIVYELIAEWGETRLVPVFYDIDEGKVGPVRSIRHYFIQFVMEYDPVIVHIGYSPQAQSMLSKNNIASVNGLFGQPYPVFFDITKEKNNWQDTYTDFISLNKLIPLKKFRIEPSKSFPFEYSDIQLDGETAEKIFVEYSKGYNIGFEYDKKTGLYARKRKGEYHIERYSGEILAARNIIIQRVVTYPIKNDTSGRMTMDNVGKGEGLYITGGKSEEIKWEKTSDFAQTSYTYSNNGEKITLNEGQTWIIVTATDSKVIIE
jgi:hypothetical protein